MSNYWKRVEFWENVKRTFATFSGPAVLGVHEFADKDIWVVIAGALAMLGGVLSIWMTDKDNDGYVDMFEGDIEDHNKV